MPIVRTNDERITALQEQMQQVLNEARVDLPDDFRPDGLATTMFAMVMQYKMRIAALRYGWTDSPWLAPQWETDWRRALHEHVAKGDPVDVAIYCLFGWFHGWSTATPRREDAR